MHYAFPAARRRHRRGASSAASLVAPFHLCFFPSRFSVPGETLLFVHRKRIAIARSPSPRGKKIIASIGTRGWTDISRA